MSLGSAELLSALKPWVALLWGGADPRYRCCYEDYDETLQ